MTTNWHSTHLNKFIETIEDAGNSFKGKNPTTWHLNVERQDKDNELQIGDALNLPLERQDRVELREWLDSDNGANVRECCVNVLAWGAMNTKYGYSAFKTFDQWMPIIEDLCSVKIDVIEAYDRFLNLRSSMQLKGMGVAYYTKLLFFFSHTSDYLKSSKQRGYILDQWTARSINLLCDREIINLNVPKSGGTQTVTDKNTASVYLQFCSLIEELSEKIGHTPSRTEELLFSTGYNKGAWRRYVINNFKP